MGEPDAHVGDVLDDLDGEQPDEPFIVHTAGRTVTFRPAAGPGWRDLLEAMAWPPAFVDRFGPTDRSGIVVVEALPVWQMRQVLRAWRVHHGLCPRHADNVRLAAMLSKPAYRTAAERDLRETHRLDLTEQWRSRRWRRLLNLLEGLRRTSHMYEATTQDEDLAKEYLARERRGTVSGKPHRRMTEFSVEAELLSYAVDRLGELIQAQAMGKGAKRRKVQPMPRPETAITRVRERQARQKHTFTVARVFGYVDETGRPTGRGPAQSTPPTS